MNDLEAKLMAALDRLGNVLERIQSARPRPDPAAGIELDASKIAAKAGAAAGGAPTDDAGWRRVGEIIGAANAKVLAGALGRARSAGAGVRTRVGRTVATAGGMLAASRLGRAGTRLAGSRAGRAAGRAGRGVLRAGAWVAMSRVGRGVGRAGRAILPAALAGFGGAYVGGKAASKLTGGDAGSNKAIGGGLGGAIVGGLAGGPLGAAVGGFAGAAMGTAADGAAKALGGFTERTAEAARSVLELNRSVGQFSALMGLMNAEMDARSAIRSREKGDRLASSATFVGRADQFRQDQTKESEVFWQRIDNYATGIKNYAAGIANWPINKLYGLVNRAVEGQKVEVNPLGEATIKLGEDLLREREAADRRRAAMAAQRVGAGGGAAR